MFNAPTLKTALSKNCLSCKTYLSCKDKHKSILYFCSQYKSSPSSLDASFLRLFDADIIPSLPILSKDYDDSPVIVDQNGFDIHKTIARVIKKDSIVSPDIKIDDSDFHLFPNFYKFCTSEKGLKQKPYLEQALLGTIIFSEFCPRCSDKKWLQNHNVDDNLSIFEERVQLLTRGKCPKCKARKSEMVLNKELNYYYELAVCAGQRCVTGDTLILTQDGLMRIDEYSKGKPLGFSPFHLDVYNGKNLELTSDFYTAKPEHIFTINTREGFKLSGTKDHPIRTISRFKRIENLLVGDDFVKIQYGMAIFGNKVVYIQDILEKSDALFLTHCNKSSHSGSSCIKTEFKTCIKTKTLSDSLATYMGVWVAEGRGLKLTNWDSEVLDLCNEALSSVIYSKYIKIGKNTKGDNASIKVLGLRGKFFLTMLLGQDLLSGSALKSVPLIIRQGPKSYQTNFLKGLFEGDGGVEGTTVSYTSISKTLVDQVSSMLLNIGIVHKRRYGWSWATNGSPNQVSKRTYTLFIQGKFLELFRTEIGFITPRKIDSLDKIINIYQTRQVNMSFFYDKLPPSLKNELLTFIDEVSIDLQEYRMSKELHGSNSKWKFKPGNYLGKQSILGFSNQKSNSYTRRSTLRNDGSVKPALRDTFSRLREPNVPLTFKKLQDFCEALEKFQPYLSDSAKFKIKYFKSYLLPNIFYSKIVSIKKSKLKKVTYDFTLPDTHQFWTNGLISHNSGKSALIGMMSAYLSHWLLMLQNPNEIYGLQSSNILHGTFVALTYDQAKDTLWEPYYGYLLDSPWFTAYHDMLKDAGNRYGEELLKLKDTFVLYRHRRIYYYPAGPDKRTLRGRTRIEAVIDEIGWFDNSLNGAKIKMNANEVYIALERSLLTVRASANKLMKQGFDNVPTGYFLNISSPSSVRDKIMELVRQAQGSRKIYGVIRPTWEMNPTVTREDLEEEFRKDPVAAMRDYGAQPPLSSSPFIASRSTVEQCFNKKKNPCSIQYGVRKANDDTETRYARFTSLKRSGKPSCLAIDGGYSNNSFSCAVGHLVDERYPVIDVLVEIQPLPGIPLNYSLIYKHILVPLIDKRNVKFFTADRWNSLKILSDAQEEFEDIVTQQISVKYQDMIMLKEYMQDQEMNMPPPEIPVDEILAYPHSEYPNFFKHYPVAHCVLQFLTVQDTGSSVIKGDQLTDDLVRAIMLAHRVLVDPNYAGYFTQEEEAPPASAWDVTQMGVYKGASGGTSSKLGGMSANAQSSLGMRVSRTNK